MPSVATVGDNSFGQLGRPNEKNGELSVVELDAEILQVSCGENHTIVITVTQRLIGWGSNSDGQLGEFPEVSVITAPRYLLSSYDLAVSQVSCGERHTMILTADGIVYVFGSGLFGQLGQSSSVYPFSSAPVKITIPEAVHEIVSGARTCFALTALGSVFAWGETASGMLGTLQVPMPFAINPLRLHIGPQRTRVHRVVPSHRFALYVTNTFDVVGSGDNTAKQFVGVDTDATNVWKPLKISGRIRDVTCGLNSVTALLSNGNIIYSDQNTFGSWTTIRISQCVGVASGYECSFCWTAEGAVSSWGRNDAGQLGIGNCFDVQEPTSVRLPEGYNAIAVSSGRCHTAVLLNNFSENEKVMPLVEMEDAPSSSDEDEMLQTISGTQWDEGIPSLSFSRRPKMNTGNQSSLSRSESILRNGSVKSAASNRPDDEYDAFRFAKIAALTCVVAAALGALGFWIGRRDMFRR
jgi:alpha-tubulin suppressor-like RCC1 family protein